MTLGRIRVYFINWIIPMSLDMKTLIWNDQTVNIGWLKKNFTISDKDNNGKKLKIC